MWMAPTTWSNKTRCPDKMLQGTVAESLCIILLYLDSDCVCDIPVICFSHFSCSSRSRCSSLRFSISDLRFAIGDC